MKVKNIVDTLLANASSITKHGNIDQKILLELKMATSLYDYIEVVTDYYDNEDNSLINSWTDVEGMGYGWRWLNYVEDKWHEMMSKIVSEQCEYLSLHINNGYYIVYENQRGKVYHFINFVSSRTDTIITMSNDELDY